MLRAARAVRAVDKAFPNVEFKNWGRCQRLLPHAHACASLVEKWGYAFPEAAKLLNRAAFYLHERALFATAEPLYSRALAIREKLLGPEHLDVASSLNNLAGLCATHGRYAEAERLYKLRTELYEGRHTVSSGREGPIAGRQRFEDQVIRW